VRVKVLDLDTFAGGLTPVEAGGGFQTKSLRFTGKDGRQYKFRSVNKDPRAVLPLELRETFAADVARDHISTAHPAAALVVDALGGAVGVPRLQPQIVLLPDDDRLGEFRERFGGILGIFETYPDDGFLGSVKVDNALKVYTEMEENSEDGLDAASFLKARLLDIYVGDWDRHPKQWKWARFEKEGRKVWYPIPLDRDQAFVRIDGLIPWVSTMAITQFESFDRKFPNIYGLTFSGTNLDRRLLVGMDKHLWDSVVTEFVSNLTDQVIEGAVREVPPEYYENDGRRLTEALKSRRGLFKTAADKYYMQLSDFVDVYLSDKREYVEVKRLDGRGTSVVPGGAGDDRFGVEVTAWQREKDTGAPKGLPVFHRLFRCAETKEIRIYMLGGDDKAVVTGDVESSIPVRLIGGKGDDEMVDDSIVRGVLFGFIPFIPSADRATYFYDGPGHNKLVAGPSCVIEEE
jgi:hypothetical protein